MCIGTCVDGCGCSFTDGENTTYSQIGGAHTFGVSCSTVAACACPMIAATGLGSCTGPAFSVGGANGEIPVSNGAGAVTWQTYSPPTPPSDGAGTLATCEAPSMTAPLQQFPMFNDGGVLKVFGPARHTALGLSANGSVVNPAYNNNNLCTASITVTNPSTCRTMLFGIGISTVSVWSAAATNSAIELQITTPGGTFVGPKQEISAGGATAFPAGVDRSVSWFLANQSVAPGATSVFTARAVLVSGTPGAGTGNMTVQLHILGVTQ